MKCRLIVATSGFLSVFLLSGCLSTGGGVSDVQLAAAADAVRAVTVSDTELQETTRQMMATMDAKNPVAPASNPYGKRLENIIRGHTNEDGMNLNFKVYLVSDINAFATPDGSVRVFAGLMDRMTDDELRSIIGHEIGHVKLGHSLKAARTAYLTSAAAKVAGSQGLTAQVLADLGEKVVNAQFSQSQESDADAYGVSFLRRNKYNLQAAESAMRKLAELDGTAAGGSSSLFASHPGSKQRADKIHELITKK